MATIPPDAESMVTSQTASGVPVRVVPNGWQPAPDNLTLTVAELTWLDRFRAQLLEEFVEIIEDIIVYGHRARGMADLSLEFKIMVVARELDSAIKERINDLAYDLDLEIGCTTTIYALSGQDWVEVKKNRSSFHRAAAEEGITVL